MEIHFGFVELIEYIIKNTKFMLNFFKYLIFFNSIWMKIKKKIRKGGEKILFFQFTSAQFIKNECLNK